MSYNSSFDHIFFAGIILILFNMQNSLFLISKLSEFQDDLSLLFETIEDIGDLDC